MDKDKIDDTAQHMKEQMILHCVHALERAKKQLGPNRKRLDRNYVKRIITDAQKLSPSINRHDRGRNRQLREQGKQQEKEFKELKGSMTAGELWEDYNSNRIGMIVTDRVTKKHVSQKEQQLLTFNNAKNQFIKMNYQATEASKVDRKLWKGDHYRAMIAPLRRKGDAPLPKFVVDLPSLYDELIKTRSPLGFGDHLRINKSNIVIPKSVDMKRRLM